MVEDQETAHELAELLRHLRTERKLSVRRLAKLSGIARKTIDNIEAGQNVSVFVLQKLLATLGVEEITFRVNGRPAFQTSRSGNGLSAEALIEIVAELRRRLDLVTKDFAAVAQVADLLDPRTEQSQMLSQADKLIRRFSEFVRTVGDPNELAALEHSMSDLYVASTEPRSASAPPPGRRKRSA